MKKATYIEMANRVRNSKILYNSVIVSDKILTKISYIVYPIFLIFLIIKKEPEFAKAVAVPAVSFIVLSIFRYIYCAPRPYEVFGIPPVIKKNTKGKSFPSRHVFSAFIIAGTICFYYPHVGTVLSILAALLAVVRVAGGVHFIKDVTVGAALGIVCSFAGFYII